MVIHHNFLDKLRSNIYIYIYVYRARGLKRLISALGITLLVAVFCGIIGITSHEALAESSGNAELHAIMSDISIDVTIPTNIVTLNLDPTASLESDDMDIIVSTDAPYGYTLTMTADSSNLTRTTALDGAYPTIPTLAQDSTQVGFAANHWGWKLPDDTKWHPFNPTGVTVGSSEEPVTSKTDTVAFAAKANSVTPVGDYKIDLTFAATANSRPISIYDVVYMQDFKEASDSDKSSILSSMTEGTSYPLKDSRDNQEYTVAKLFDGNIWMTKNLNLAGGTKLYSDTSNVPDGYPSSGNNPYYTLPTSSTSGFSNDSTAYVYNSGSTTCASNNPCYSYYSYLAATAGTNPSSGDATSDICPAGWRLPTKSEYETLLGTYDTAAKLTASPFLGVYSGRYDNSSFARGGNTGLYWSSTANSSTIAYRFHFDSSSTSISDGNKRIGFSARCILQ